MAPTGAQRSAVRQPERLSAADAWNVVIDAPDQVNVFLLAGVLGGGGFVARDGSSDLDALRDFIAGRLRDEAPKLVRLSRRVRTVGRHLAWESCAPDLAEHVRAVDAADGLAGLADLCARLMTEPMPLDRPRWEVLIVPGATPEGPGIIVRVHHAVTDGLAAVALVQHLFGSGPTTAPPVPHADAPPATSQPAHWRRVLRAAMRITAVLRPTVPRTVLLGPIGPRRGLVFAEVDLAALKSAARSADATVNDALLAAVTAGVVAALRAAGEPVPVVLPASVPVALPHPSGSGNAVGVMLVPLPTGEPDVAVRLDLIAAATKSAKYEARAQGTYELTRTR